MNARQLIEAEDPEEGKTEVVDLTTGDQIEISIHGHKGRFVDKPGGWRPFQDPEHMFGWLAHYAVDSERWRVAHRVASQQQHQTPDVSMERKRELMVWEDEDWLILQMPADVDFIHREGIDMQHCLGHRGTAEMYCQQMQGEQDQYSLVKKKDGKPYVNFEVAITRSSYGGPVDGPTITQIRGRRNQCPPADEYIVPLKKFFDANPEWTVSGHGVRSFDGGVDGDKFAARVAQMDQSLFESALDYGSDGELLYYCIIAEGGSVINDTHKIVEGLKRAGAKYMVMTTPNQDETAVVIKTTMEPGLFEKLVPEKYVKHCLYEGLITPAHLTPAANGGAYLYDPNDPDHEYWNLWYQALTEGERAESVSKEEIDRDYCQVMLKGDGIAESLKDHEIEYEECPVCAHTKCICECPDCGGYERLEDSRGKFHLFCETRAQDDYYECPACAGGNDPTGENCTCDEISCSGPYGRWMDAGAPMSDAAHENLLDVWYDKLREQAKSYQEKQGLNENLNAWSAVTSVDVDNGWDPGFDTGLNLTAEEKEEARQNVVMLYDSEGAYNDDIREFAETDRPSTWLRNNGYTHVIEGGCYGGYHQVHLSKKHFEPGSDQSGEGDMECASYPINFVGVSYDDEYIGRTPEILQRALRRNIECNEGRNDCPWIAQDEEEDDSPI